MLNRMFVSDMQDEISAIQSDLKNLSNEQQVEQKPNNAAVAAAAIDYWSDKSPGSFNDAYGKAKDGANPNAMAHGQMADYGDDKKVNFDKELDQFATKMLNDHLIKTELKVEQDMVAGNVDNMAPPPPHPSAALKKPMLNMHANNIGGYRSSIAHNADESVGGHGAAGNGLNDADVKPAYLQSHAPSMDNAPPPQPPPLPSLDMTHFGYDLIDSAPAAATGPSGQKARPPHVYSVKKELDNLDIESEITPSYIIKKCDQREANMRRPVVHSPLSTSDFDYLCSSNEQHDAANSTANSQRKDDGLAACDKEPYDEWLCIQKELNLISDKRASELTIDGFMESTFRAAGVDVDAVAAAAAVDACDADKLNVEKELSDLFSEAGADGAHGLDAAKNDIDSHLPLSDLFNDSMVNDTIEANDKDSVESRLENMFAEDDEFDKANDLVESQLEELFHGTSPSATPGAASSGQSLR